MQRFFPSMLRCLMKIILKGLGCDFALKSCKEWMDSRNRRRMSIHPYCNKVNRYS